MTTTGSKKRIIIFASGNGTNAENIIKYFKNSSLAEVVMLLSNKKDAKALARAKGEGVDAQSFNREELNNPDAVLKTIRNAKPDIIVLAGFLWKFPEHIINEYPGKVINIHPALLPKYGGKGMYGKYVHEAVVANKEAESGITIHYVNANYDEGAVIFQARTSITPDDSADAVAAKVHELEYAHFPRVIEELLS